MASAAPGAGVTVLTREHRDRRTAGEVGPEVRETPADQHMSVSALATVLLVIAAVVAVA